jgi:threonine dehydrogenase-like Zn-dependent dehydrogenase
MLEPLSVAVHANSRVGTRAGESVLITGCGPIGLLSALVARAAGATKVIMMDVDKSKLDVALKMVATHVINVRAKTPEEGSAEIRALNEGVGVDKCIECSGAESACLTAVMATVSGGTVCMVGHGQPLVKVPMGKKAMIL